MNEPKVTTGMNLDQLAELMQMDDLEEATRLTPRDYARLRSVTTGHTVFPQKVYKAIREGKLTPRPCECGRKTINIEEADKVFGYNQGGEQDEAV